jgi:hypothetical protein
MIGKEGPMIGWWTIVLVALLLGSGTPSGARVCLAPKTGPGSASTHPSDSDIWGVIGP